MKRKLWVLAAALAVCLMIAIPATAANVFAFTENAISLFEGEAAETALNRDGSFAEGEVVYSSESTKVATVSEDGTVTAVAKGKTRVFADLMQNGKRVRRASVTVQVVRRVTKVTMSRKNLVVLEPDDPSLAGLLAPLPEDAAPRTDPVLVILAGRTVNLSAVCTPEDANNRKISFTSSDVGIAKVDGTRLRGMEKGECELTVASVQNPEIQEIFHVVVIEPVKKLQIDAGDKTMFAGEQKMLSAVITPETASIQQVTWSSRKPAVATVDENGLVTGLAKGDVTIEARTTDGTEIVAAVNIRVAQNVTEITLKQEELTLSVNRSATLNATVLPKEANNKKLNWSSSDESIATVNRNGQVTGKKAGIAVITCVSDSNPAVSAITVVQVVQPVTKITFDSAGGLTFPIRESRQLSWNVEPYDASIKDVTFTSNHPEIATVDANGLVTGVKRGEARITATATDGSKRSAQIKVVITQPAEGVEMAKPLYYIQLGRATTVRANVLPKDANNKKVYWEAGDDSIIVRSSGTSSASVTGVYSGMSSVTAITDDGGFTATAQLQIADFDAAILVEGLEITADNKIRITLRNVGEPVVNKVYFHVDCLDPMNQPMIYNQDGVSTGFDGEYPLPLQSGERSIHGQFRFGKWMDTGMLGAVKVTVTGYEFDNGQKWEIPEEDRITVQAFSDLWGKVTPTPMPPVEQPAEQPAEQGNPEGDSNG